MNKSQHRNGVSHLIDFSYLWYYTLTKVIPRLNGSGLKNSLTAPIKGIEPSGANSAFYPMGEVGYPVLDQYIMQFQTVVTFEP